ncbi:MAG: hypothetical protein HYW27_04410 [Candidatus Aenigmarchaeota archaeon]|nr:hypothetical protein [Candidatus Aenigmarchaeota archaeon]
MKPLLLALSFSLSTASFADPRLANPRCILTLLREFTIERALDPTYRLLTPQQARKYYAAYGVRAERNKHGEWELVSKYFTAPEIDAIRKYVNYSYRPINEYLRHGTLSKDGARAIRRELKLMGMESEGDPLELPKKWIALIDSVIEKSPLVAGETVLFRFESFPIETRMKPVGSTYFNKGYVSTTLLPKIATGYANGVAKLAWQEELILVLNVIRIPPGGIPGAYVLRPTSPTTLLLT